jgi:DNA-binding XRE family transcriptional regulator
MTSLLQTHDEQRLAIDVAAWLVKMRERLDVGQKQIAKAAGVTRNTVSSWERARTVPTLVQIERIKVFEKNYKRAKGLTR